MNIPPEGGEFLNLPGKQVTYDFYRLMDGTTLLKCSEFGGAVIANM